MANPFAFQQWAVELILIYGFMAGARGEKANQRIVPVPEPCYSQGMWTFFYKFLCFWYLCAWRCMLFPLPWRILVFFVFICYILRQNTLPWQEEGNKRKWLTQIIAMKYLFTLHSICTKKIAINIAVMPKQTFSEMLLEVFRNMALTDEEMKVTL